MKNAAGKANDERRDEHEPRILETKGTLEGPGSVEWTGYNKKWLLAADGGVRALGRLDLRRAMVKSIGS